MNLYSIQDVKTGAYSSPFVGDNDEIGVRLFRQVIADPDTTPGQFPEDFRLYRVGRWDSETGSVEDEPNWLVMEGGSVATWLLNLKELQETG